MAGASAVSAQSAATRIHARRRIIRIATAEYEAARFLKTRFIRAASPRQHKLAEQGPQVWRALQRPQRLQDRRRALRRPCLANGAAEFALDVGPAHRLPGKARHIVDLACDLASVVECRGDAR